MEDEIDLRDIFRVLWKRRLLIIGVFVAFVLVAGVISFAIPPEYKISSIVAVGNFDDPVYVSQASMLNVMTSDEFAREVFEEIHPNSTGSEFQAFKDGINVETVKGSDRLIGISIETGKKQEGLMGIEKMIQL
jgi:capsular polysaccharide biosynthesis protein